MPGMRVDVLISGALPSGTAGPGTLTRSLFQNIEVLSAGQDFKNDADGRPVAVQVVHLLLSPDQDEQLSLASHQTTIQVVLRNPLDRPARLTPVAPSFPADAPLWRPGSLSGPHSAPPSQRHRIG